MEYADRELEDRRQKLWALIDRRSLYCIVLSVLCHALLMVVFIVLVFAKGGEMGEEIVSLTYKMEKSEQNSSDKASKKNNDSPNSVDAMKIAQRLEDSEIFSESEQETELLEKIFSDTGEEESKQIEENIKNRSLQGELTPKTFFFGIAIHAHHIIMALDVSSSMDIPETMKQIKNAYGRLTAKEKFTIIAYGKEVRQWKRILLSATEQNKNMAGKWLLSLEKEILYYKELDKQIDQLEKSGGNQSKLDSLKNQYRSYWLAPTDLYLGLQTAFEVAGTIPKSEIYLVSDGKATWGIANEKKLLKAVRSWNSGRKIRLHTIGIGFHQKNTFLRKLAEENRGTYHEKY